MQNKLSDNAIVECYDFKELPNVDDLEVASLAAEAGVEALQPHLKPEVEKRNELNEGEQDADDETEGEEEEEESSEDCGSSISDPYDEAVLRQMLDQTEDVDEAVIAKEAKLEADQLPKKAFTGVIAEGDEISYVGKIQSIIGAQIIIQGEGTPLEVGSVLCTEDRKALGHIADLFGRVDEPLYVVLYEPVKASDNSDSKEEKGVENNPTGEGGANPSSKANEAAESGNVKGASNSSTVSGENEPEQVGKTAATEFSAGMCVYSVNRLSNQLLAEELESLVVDDEADDQFEASDEDAESKLMRTQPKAKVVPKQRANVDRRRPRAPMQNRPMPYRNMPPEFMQPHPESDPWFMNTPQPPGLRGYGQMHVQRQSYTMQMASMYQGPMMNPNMMPQQPGPMHPVFYNHGNLYPEGPMMRPQYNNYDYSPPYPMQEQFNMRPAYFRPHNNQGRGRSHNNRGRHGGWNNRSRR